MAIQTTTHNEEAEMELYAGIDLHSNNNVLVVLDESDRVSYQKRLPNVLADILVLAGGWLAGSRVRRASGQYRSRQTI